MPKKIMDPVHGLIDLDDWQKAVIDHPLFQRLRFVSQNDILFLTFPGAKHDRFIHSIGASHLAKQIWSSMVRNHRDECSDSYTFNGKTTEALNYLGTCIQLAALMHDLGHLPFSHQSEKSEAMQSILLSDQVLESINSDISQSLPKGKINSFVSHEVLSLRIAITILNDVENLIPVEISDVLMLLDGAEIAPSERFIDYTKSFTDFLAGRSKTNSINPDKEIIITKTLLKSILSNSIIDCDRLDYLLRDTFHSNSSFGPRNLDYVLDNLRFGFKYNGAWAGMVINEKALSCVEDLCITRYQSYRHIYGHKTAVGFSYILKRAIAEILSEQSTYYFVQASLLEAKRFELLTDTYFWEKFRLYKWKYKNSWCERLINREPLRFMESDGFQTHHQRISVKGPGVFKSTNEVDDFRVLRKSGNKLQQLRLAEASSILNGLDTKPIYFHYETPNVGEFNEISSTSETAAL